MPMFKMKGQPSFHLSQTIRQDSSKLARAQSRSQCKGSVGSSPSGCSTVGDLISVRSLANVHRLRESCIIFTLCITLSLGMRRTQCVCSWYFYSTSGCRLLFNWIIVLIPHTVRCMGICYIGHGRRLSLKFVINPERKALIYSYCNTG